MLQLLLFQRRQSALLMAGDGLHGVQVPLPCDRAERVGLHILIAIWAMFDDRGRAPRDW